MKKIVILSNSLWNIINFRINLVKELVNQDYKILIICDNKEKLNFDFEHSNLEIKIVKFKSKDYFSINNILYFIFLFKNIKSFNPDYLLTFTIKPNILGGIISQYLKIKNISNITGLGTLFLRGKILRYFGLILYKISIKNNLHTFFHNQKDRNLFINNNVVFKNNSSIIFGSGIDLKKYNFSKVRETNSDSLVFLYIGRIIKDKGIIEYIEALKLIKEEYPFIKFKFIGSLANDNKSNLSYSFFNDLMKQRLIEHHHFKNNIIEDLIHCDCVVLPSYREGLPKSLIESSAIGRAMIASNVPGCNDIVIDQYNGLLFEVKNVKSLYQVLKKFINLDKAKRIEMSLNANKDINKYDVNVIINKYMNLINPDKNKLL